jgi:hypothetical protein
MAATRRFERHSMTGQKADFAEDYARLKDFMAFFADHYFDLEEIPLDHRPLAVLETLEKTSRSKALVGLRQAINDCVEMSLGFGQAEVEKLDSDLRAGGMITLSELRKRYSKDYARILKRGRIANDSEFYLIQNVLNGPTEKSGKEYEKLAEIISDYETL